LLKAETRTSDLINFKRKIYALSLGGDFLVSDSSLNITVLCPAATGLPTHTHTNHTQTQGIYVVPQNRVRPREERSISLFGRKYNILHGSNNHSTSLCISLPHRSTGSLRLPPGGGALCSVSTLTLSSASRGRTRFWGTT